MGQFPSTKRIRLYLWSIFIIYESLTILTNVQRTIPRLASHSHTKRHGNIKHLSQSVDIRPLLETPFWNETEYLLNLDTATADEWDQRYVPELGYPRKTVVEDFETQAVSREVEKHDRWILQGMQFMKRFARNPGQPSKAAYSKATNHARLTIAITVCNRRIPYIYALLHSLLHNDDLDFTSTTNITHSSSLLSFAQIHLLNTEKRPAAQVLFPGTLFNQSFTNYFHQTFSHLPFIHALHDLTQNDPILEEILQQQQRQPTYHETTISDHLMALRICVDNSTPWCLIMEEDAIVSSHFVSSLLHDVLNPLEKKRPSISIVSLYSYYNLVFKGDVRLHDPSYSKFFYDEDSSHWTSLNKTRKKRNYTVSNKEYKYGAVANLYTLESARKLIAYLEELVVDNPEHNADEYINAEEHFPLAVGAARKQVEPSLVNHIGFYSERMAHVTSRGMFSQLNTDVRFI